MAGKGEALTHRCTLGNLQQLHRRLVLGAGTDDHATRLDAGQLHGLQVGCYNNLAVLNTLVAFGENLVA